MKKISVIAIVLIVVFMFYGLGFAAGKTVSLMWDPPEIATDVVGYKVYYGKESGTYTGSVDVKNVLAYKFPAGVLSAGTWYFAVTAYNAATYESEYSNEVVIGWPMLPRNLKVLFEVTVIVQ